MLPCQVNVYYDLEVPYVLISVQSMSYVMSASLILISLSVTTI